MSTRETINEKKLDKAASIATRALAVVIAAFLCSYLQMRLLWPLKTI